MIHSTEFISLSKHIGVIGLFFILLVLSLFGLNKINENMIDYTNINNKFYEHVDDDVDDDDENEVNDNIYHQEILNIRKKFIDYISNMEIQFEKSKENIDNEVDKINNIMNTQKYI